MIRDELEAALQELELDAGVRDSSGVQSPQVFIWQDEEFPCVSSTTENSTVFSDYGNYVDIVQTLRVRISLFDDAFGVGEGRPVSGDLIEFHDVDYRIIKIAVSPDRGHFTLHCADPNSNQ